MSPSGINVSSFGGGKPAGTQRRCANCGQIGHIKTNKKYYYHAVYHKPCNCYLYFGLEECMLTFCSSLPDYVRSLMARWITKKKTVPPRLGTAQLTTHQSQLYRQLRTPLSQHLYHQHHLCHLYSMIIFIFHIVDGPSLKKVRHIPTAFGLSV